jgi:hypothetical protein
MSAKEIYDVNELAAYDSDEDVAVNENANKQSATEPKKYVCHSESSTPSPRSGH